VETIQYGIISDDAKNCRNLPSKLTLFDQRRCRYAPPQNLGDRLSGLRIYGIARTRAFRVLWIANELGLDYEHLPIEIGAAGAGSPEFLAINPNGRLPFIVDNGFVLFESLAITLYLAKKHSNDKLYPDTLEGEASAWQWSLWAVTEVDRGVNIWSLHAIRLPAAERDAIKRNEALRVLVAPFEVLDAAVAKQKYLLGNDFTVADLNVAAVISRAVDMDLSATPNLKAWLTRCLDRPAAQKALALKAKADNETPTEVIQRIAKINRL
jgi:glutathione S-transferase